MTASRTLGALFYQTCQKRRHQKVLGYIDNKKLKYINGEKYLFEVEKLALWFNQLNLKKSTKIGILSRTSIKWHLTDLAVLCSGFTTIPINPFFSSQEIIYVLNHSECDVLFLENPYQFKRFIDIQSKCPKIKHIISYSDIKNENIKKLSNEIKFHHFSKIDLDKANQEKQLDSFINRINEIKPNDIASIVYTSDANGKLKGIILTHKAFYTTLINFKKFMQNRINNRDCNLVHLPLSHMLGRCDSFLNLFFENQTVYIERTEEIFKYVNIVKPTFITTFPHTLEQIYKNITQKVEKREPLLKKIFQWAEEISNVYFEKIDNDLSPTTIEVAKRNLAYKLVYQKIYNRMGGHIRFFITGNAPLRKGLFLSLRNANFPVLESYGLTETLSLCSLNPLNKQIPGTVGLPIGEVQIDFAKDSEIRIKTKGMFQGYYKDIKATNEVFQNGWLYTGDLGKLTSNGYIQIIGCKKDLITMHSSKNYVVASRKIENMMQAKTFINYFMVIGEGRKFLAGIVGVDKKSLNPYFEKLGLPLETGLADVVKIPEVQALIQKEVDSVNEGLPGLEVIKRIYIAPLEFTVANGLLTPDLKIKKRIIYNKFKTEIDSMYQ